METENASAQKLKDYKPTGSVYEVKAIDKQAVSLLEIVNEINGQLDAAKTLRRQRDGALSASEKLLVDRTFEESETTVSEVAKLVEPCQVEMKSNKGNLAFGKRLVYILRDSPEIMGSLVRLGFASERLQAALDILCGREVLQNPSWLESLPGIHQPPTYEESQSLIRNRRGKGLPNSEFLTTSPTRPSSVNAATGIRSLVEDFIALGPLIDATSNTGSPRTQQDELFFDCVADQTRDTAGPTVYQPYRPTEASAEPSDAPRWTSRSASENDIYDAPRIDTSSVSAHRGGASTTTGLARRSRPISHIPTPLAMLKSHASGAPDPPPPTAFLSTSKLKWNSKPPVKPKPAALRAGTSNNGLLDDPVPVKAGNRRDWETLPSQEQYAKRVSTFVLTCPSPGEGDRHPARLLHHMVKLDGCHARSEEVSAVQIDMIPGSLQPGRSILPSIQSEFPEVVPASSMPWDPTTSPGSPAVGPNTGSEGTALVTEVSADMIARSRSCRQAHLLDRANHAPEVVPDGAPDVRPPIPPKMPEYMVSSEISVEANTTYQRHLSVSSWTSSLDVDRDSSDFRGRDAGQSLLTGKARSQRWRELQYERSQALERGRWFK